MNSKNLTNVSFGPRPSNPIRLRGFTLVELMVSIVIVAILAAMVTMFAKRGIQAAKATKCTSNMRQVHTGLMTVVESGVRTTYHPSGTFPPYAGAQAEPSDRFVWWDLVGENMGIAESVGGEYIWKVHPKETVFQNPLSDLTLGGEGDEWKVFHGNPDASGGSFALNSQLSGMITPETAPEEARAEVHRTSEVPFPGSTILFGETDDTAAETGKVTAAFLGVENAPQGNYRKSTHCIFVDGHVELILNKRLKDQEWLDHYRLRKPPEKKLSQPT